MNNKVYSENYVNYQHTQCSKQIQQTDGQSLYPYSNISLNNTYNPTTNYMDVYSAPPQNVSRGQQNSNCLHINTYQEQMDFVCWENRLSDVEKTVKIPDKIETIEITSKDLSPASYCSNIDLLASDCYKPNSAGWHNSNQWYNNQSNYSQRNVDFPSCAKEKSTKYWSMQKNPDVDPNIKNYASNDILLEGSDIVYKNNRNISNDTYFDYNISYSYYDNRFTENQHIIQNENYFNASTSIPFEPLINPIDQQTECSNDESDIIVEESDEEITDYSEDQEKRQSYQTNKCFICNVMYTPLGTQFYFLTSENPLTMSSQKPVYDKIVNIIGKLSDIKNYLCSECLGLINTIDHLQLKLENFHNELVTKFRKTCSINGTTYKQVSYNKKTKPLLKFPKYRCKLCKKILCTRNYCRFHLKKHKNRGYLCELCGKITSNRRKFFIHLKKHKKKIFVLKIEAFKCSNCDKMFRTKTNLREHENYCLGTLPFKCKSQHCDKKFPTATKLRNHVKLKHDKKFMAICSICNIGFVKISDYKSHMVSHSTDKKFSCTKCDKSYKTLSNLNFHMKTHNNELPFNCDICKKGFMRKEYLEAHVNNHKGIKNFGCTVCDKKFASQKNLDAHLKYHDGTIKKNKCNICGKLFSSGFEEHLRVHNNLREFECEHCDMKFNTKSSLSKHAKKKHSHVSSLKSSNT